MFLLGNVLTERNISASRTHLDPIYKSYYKTTGDAQDYAVPFLMKLLFFYVVPLYFIDVPTFAKRKCLGKFYGPTVAPWNHSPMSSPKVKNIVKT